MKLRALLPLIVLLGACVAPKNSDELSQTNFLPTKAQTDHQPVDVGIAPVRVVMLEEGDAPAEALRDALYEGLMDRMYSPLPNAWVDGGGESDALIQVRILQWDRSQLAYDGTIMARAEARMVVPEGSMWAVDITRRLNRNVGGKDRADSDLAEASCVRDLASELLELLPKRDPLRP